MTELTIDQLRAFDRELRQRDPRFLRVVDANPDDGQGTYELRSATTGATARAPFTFCEHGNVLSPRFDAETTLRLAAAAKAPDPYAAPLAAMRAAAATPLRKFEDDFKAARLAGLEATRTALAADEPEARVGAVELAAYAPPDPYAAGLKALRAKETR
jgi:hypothetical protein